MFIFVRRALLAGWTAVPVMEISGRIELRDSVVVFSPISLVGTLPHDIKCIFFHKSYYGVPLLYYVTVV